MYVTSATIISLGEVESSLLTPARFCQKRLVLMMYEQKRALSQHEEGNGTGVINLLTSALHFTIAQSLKCRGFVESRTIPLCFFISSTFIPSAFSPLSFHLVSLSPQLCHPVNFVFSSAFSSPHLSSPSFSIPSAFISHCVFVP